MQIMPREKFQASKPGMSESIDLFDALQELSSPVVGEDKVVKLENLDQLEEMLEAHGRATACPLCQQPLGLRIFGVRRVSFGINGCNLQQSIRVECTNCLKFLEKDADESDFVGLEVTSGDMVDVD